jgi:hypothetical protein
MSDILRGRPRGIPRTIALPVPADLECIGAVVPVGAAGWGEPLFVRNAESSLQRPHVTINDEGSVLAVWEEGGNMWQSEYALGLGWTAPGILGYGGVFSDLALSSDGSAMAVWESTPGVQPHAVMAARHVDGIGWETPVRICSGLQMAFDKAGTCMASWIEYDGSTWEMWYNVNDPVLGWERPARIDPSDNGRWMREHQAVSSLPGAFIFIDDKCDPAIDALSVWTNMYVQGSGWTWMQRLEFNTASDSYLHMPQLATDGLGKVIITWARSDGVAENIWSAKYTGDVWSSPSLVEKSNFDCALPDVAVDSSGSAICVYMKVINKSYGTSGIFTSSTDIAY